MSTALAEIEKEMTTSRVINFRTGDNVRVSVKIKEGNKERVQVYEGMVIAIARAGSRTTFTVRKISYGVGVERVFPLHAPTVQGIEVVGNRRVRRSRLYFARKLSGKAAQLKEPRFYPRGGAGIETNSGE